jgi:hypothetical protein
MPIRTGLLAPLCAAVLLPDLAAQDLPLPCLSASPAETWLDSADETRLNQVYALRLSNDGSPRTLTAVELFTGDTRADTDVQIWTHDPVADAPARFRGQAAWWLSENPGWQGALLRPAVRLQAGEVFWLIWSAPRSVQLSVEALDPAGEPFREGAFVPNGPIQRRYRWKYRLWCGGREPGEFVTLGGPCGGANRQPPNILAEPSVPALGRPFALRTRGGPRAAPALLAFGLQAQRLGGTIPLPLDLGPFGAPECAVHADVLGGVATRTDAAGEAVVPLRLPADRSLVGRIFYAQWFVFDPRANALGLLTSAAAACRLGT